MATRRVSHDQRWASVTPHDVDRLLAGISARWWIAGGWALDVDRRQPHGDIDVAVLRPEHESLRDDLPDWDLRIAYKGELRQWHGGAVGPPENAVWGRPSTEDEWHIDFKIELVEGDEWVYRRDPTVRRPLGAIGRVVGGIPFPDRDVARLYLER